MIPDSIQILPPEPNNIVAFGIGSIAVVVAVVWILIFSIGSRRRAISLAIVSALVMAVSSFAALSGKLAQFDSFPPPMIIMILSVFLMAGVFGFSSLGRLSVRGVSLAALVGLQIFRLPLELVMHHAYTSGIMPVELSYSGYNFDIVTGVGALILFVLFKAGRRVPNVFIWLWNIWGSLALIAIAVIAITTSPIVRFFGDDPSHLNTWVLYFPYVWLPVVLVTIAISTHIIIWRKLLAHPPQVCHSYSSKVKPM